MRNNRIALLFNYLAAFLLFSFGIIYLTKSSFMPYHAQALGQTWEMINTPTQTLILALMRCVAGGYLAVSIAITIMQYNFRRTGKCWLAWVILLSGWIVTGASVYATILVRLNTPGNPPTTLAFIGLGLFLLGFIYNKKSLRRR